MSLFYALIGCILVCCHLELKISIFILICFLTVSRIIFASFCFCPMLFLPSVIFAPCSFCPFTKANYFALSSIHPNMVACVLHKYNTVKRNHPASFRSLKGHDSSIPLSTSKHALVSLLQSTAVSINFEAVIPSFCSLPPQFEQRGNLKEFE